MNAFGILDDALSVRSPTWWGARTGIADIYLAMLLTWYPDQPALHRACPNLQTALQQTLTLEGVSKVFEDNELI